MAPGAGIAVLMYHTVSGIDERQRHPYYRTDTHPERFAEQLQILRDAGYRVISLRDAAKAVETHAVTEKTAVITFDDGCGDFLTNAFPVLARFRYPATMFLPTSYISDTSKGFGGSQCLTWKQVAELHGAGIEFGSHTVTHPQLTTVSRVQVEDELRRSKETIEDRLGSRVYSFSYPYAFPEADRDFCHELRELLLEAGYQYGVSTIIGTANRSSDPFFMERLPANSCDDPAFFLAKLKGAYNWMHTFQYMSKVVGRGLAGKRARQN